MRLDLPPAFFLGAYIRLAMLGGLGLFVLGFGAALAPGRPSDLMSTPPTNAYGLAQIIVGLVVFFAHDAWRRRVAASEFEPFLRRAYFVLGALAFLAGAAVFFPLAIGRAVTGNPAIAELVVAALSLIFAVRFARAVTSELAPT